MQRRKDQNSSFKVRKGGSLIEKRKSKSKPKVVPNLRVFLENSEVIEGSNDEDNNEEDVDDTGIDLKIEMKIEMKEYVEPTINP